MLRKTRIAAATVIFAALTLLFLDFTGTLHRWLDWLAGIQFIPAVLSVHLVTVALLVIAEGVERRVEVAELHVDEAEEHHGVLGEFHLVN